MMHYYNAEFEKVNMISKNVENHNRHYPNILEQA